MNQTELDELLRQHKEAFGIYLKLSHMTPYDYSEECCGKWLLIERLEALQAQNNLDSPDSE